MRRLSHAVVKMPPFLAIPHSGGIFHELSPAPDVILSLAEGRAVIDAIERSESQPRGAFAGPPHGTVANTYYLDIFEPYCLGASVSTLSIGPGHYASLRGRGRDFESFVRDIHQAIRQEPVLDGYNHPGESIILEAFVEQPEAVALWVVDELKNGRAKSMTADFLRLLCRRKFHTTRWRREVVTVALRSNSEEVRDAGIQAVESWCDPDLVAILAEHIENVPWLAEYAGQVLKDLGKK